MRQKSLAESILKKLLQGFTEKVSLQRYACSQIFQKLQGIYCFNLNHVNFRLALIYNLLFCY